VQQKHLFTIEEVVIETGICRTNIYAHMKAKHPKAGATFTRLAIASKGIHGTPQGRQESM
jgi:hypothetical protein